MMNIPYEQPHLLFPLAAYIQSQYELIDQFVPELASCEKKVVHLTNVKQFEDLLYHLESTFLANDEKGGESYLKIPSIDIFRILITLASRCLSTNFTHGSASIDGLIANSEYIKNLNEEYENCIYKSPIRDRCITIMRSYMNLLSASKSPITVDMVYNLFLAALKDFIIQPKFFHIRGTLPKDKYLRSNRNPARRQETNIEQSHDIISDSEEEPPSLVSNTSKDIANEVKKFQPYNISPLRKNTGVFSSDNHKISGLNDSAVLFQTMPHLDSESELTSGSDGELISKKRKVRSNVRDKDSALSNIRVFGDYLISRQLNPIINSPYNLWKLMQWTFHCANFSTMYQKQLLDSNSTNCHLIFETYAKLLRLIFDFLSFNFTYHLITDKNSRRLLNIEVDNKNKHIDPVCIFFQRDRISRKEIINILENDRNILLLNLMTQLGPSRVDWYDRVIEYVFTGLNKDKPKSESSYQPQPCYEREKLLIRHDNLKKKVDKNYAVQYDDNLDSMKLRYGIIIIVYYRSLFFSDGSFINGSKVVDDSSTSQLSPKILLQQLSCKLITLDYLYLKQFYLAYYMEIAEDKFISKIHQYRMMLELTKMVLISLTGILEIDNYLSEKEMLSTHCNSSQSFIDLIVDQRLYQVLVEDETYPHWQDFEAAWCKMNYLLGWLLESSLSDLQNNSTESSNYNEFVDYIYKRVEKADRMKIKWFNKFILNHCEDNTKSDNSHVEYHFYLSDDEALELLVNEKTDTNWVKLKDIVQLKFSGIRY